MILMQRFGFDDEAKCPCDSFHVINGFLFGLDKLYNHLIS